MRRKWAAHSCVGKMAEHRLEERMGDSKMRWYFTKQELHDSPSRVHGVDSDKELSYRQHAANMIQDMGQRLNVNQLCINTAIVYMHRFYTVHSFRSFNRAQVATAAIFLAAKVEEQPRKLEHVAKVSYACQNRDAPMLDTHSETYTELIEAITYHELLILETLGFEVAVDHPHPHVVKCTHLLRASKDLSQTAYFMAHNSLLLTTFCLEHRPTVVACVCIHLACRWKGLEIPRSSDNKGWWEYVDSEITLEQLNSLTKEFLMIYDKCPSRLQKKITEPMKVMQQQSKSSGDQPSSSSSSASRHPHTSTDKGKAPAGTHSLPRKHKTANPSTAPSHAHSQSQSQSSHKPSSHPLHQQHTKHANPSHPNFTTTAQKSHDVKHHTEHHPSVSSKQHSSHSLLPPLAHGADRSRSSSPLPPGKATHKHHHHHTQAQGSCSKLPEFGGKHIISSSASKMVGTEQKQKSSKHRPTNPNHDGLRKPEQQKVTFKRSHSGENPEQKRLRLDRPPFPPPSSISSMPPLPPLPTELAPPPPPPSKEPQNLLKGHQFQMPSLATQRSTSFPPLPSVPTLPPLPPPLPSPDNEFPPPPPPPPSNSR